MPCHSFLAIVHGFEFAVNTDMGFSWSGWKGLPGQAVFLHLT